MMNSDCFQCITGQIMPLAKAASGDPEIQNQLIKRMLRIVADAGDDIAPPDIAAAFRREEMAVSGVADVYRREKDISTQLALQMLPEMRHAVENSSDWFASAVRLAVGGNIIDFGADPDFNLETAGQRVREVFDWPVDREALTRLYDAMNNAETIFYMLDNCGEAVFDRLLIERFADKITVGVRGFPILNDVTPREAEMSGIDFVPVVDTGDMTPGVSLKNSSPEFLRQMRSADLVIAKGQGNFETLSGYDRPIAFLLRVKCRVIAEILKQDMYSLQIQLRNFGI